MKGRRRGERLGAIALAVLAIAVAGAAVVDSLGKTLFRDQARVKTERADRVPDVLLADREALTVQLRRDRADGVLYFVDPSCRLHALRLPSLTTARAP